MFSSLFIQPQEILSLDKDSVNEPFILPINYLDDSEIFDLNTTVAEDLELTCKTIIDTNTDEENSSEPIKSMYHYLMNPKSKFEENNIHLWNKKYTTNIDFLKQTQHVIHSVSSIDIKSPDYDEIMTIWKDTNEDPNFLERYSYMELKMFSWINNIPSFLQAISIVNMGSPILSFLIPFILFLMPFFIVKMQGHPITLSIYFSVLKDISRNHFIGKIISGFSDFNFSSFMYLLVLGGLYVYQIYQNYIACTRFYSNISRINSQICQMQGYLSYTIKTMSSFESIINDSSSYNGFKTDLIKYRISLQHIENFIRDVHPFTPSFSKIGEIGKLLGCYYELFSNKDFSSAFKYSFSFHGYIQNIKGINENVLNGNISFASFDNTQDIDNDIDNDINNDTDNDTDKESDNESDDDIEQYINKKNDNNRCVIKGQYYPALINDDFIANDADLKTNIVITGPNAAGKTTYLKSTMLNIIFTQQFGCGFYSNCYMKPYTHLHSYLNIPDTSGRDSLFQAESRRCKEIIDTVVISKEGERHFCIFDELYSGTNPIEASKSAYALLLWLSKRANVDYILTTHYVDICSRFKDGDMNISNWKMDAIENENGDIKYTYKCIKGISKIQGAVKVLREMDYPEEILTTIKDYDTIKK
jgi:hypothetical protein